MAKGKNGNGTELETTRSVAGSLDSLHMDASELMEPINDSHAEFAMKHGLIGEKLLIMKPGMAFRGRYLGEGAMHEIIDGKTGEVKEPVRTWRFQHGSGNYIRIMGSYQLDKEMPEVVIGSLVQILHMGQKDTGSGKRVNDILVQYPRPNPIVDAERVLEASPSAAPALPASDAS